jgi:DMSO/TMAO reductase YedYZ molybdopterin-dependent catalytic subunit
VKAWQYGAFAGISAGAVALGVAEVVAVATGPRSAPLVAVGGVVVDVVPEPVKAFAIDVFYTYDKVALLVGTLVLVMLFAAVIGVLALRWLWVGLAGLTLFAGIGVAAAVTRHEAAWTAALPSLVGALAGVAILVVLLRLRTQPSVEGVDEPERVHREVTAARQRRQFLRIAGGGLAASLVLGFAGRWLASRRGVAKERAAVTLPQPASAASPLPAEVDQKLPRLTPFVTDNDDFYLIDTALVVPQVSPEEWTLRIHGRVRKPMVLTYEQLLTRPMIERYITLACVSNEVGGGLVGNARWLGVPLKDLLDEAEPEPGADQVVSRSVDGYNAGTPTALLRDGRDAMLAIGMNGEPLPIDHGFPVRMVVPGLYGYVSATKWLAELELTSFADFDAYWVRRGWAAEGPIKTQSRIDTPLHGAKPQAGAIMVAGVAWAQHRGVSKVEVQVDDEPWQEARLAPVPSIDTWRQWTWLWNARSGKHQLRVRATDNGGATQTESEAPPIPDGATGWHTIDLEVE